MLGVVTCSSVTVCERSSASEILRSFVGSGGKFRRLVGNADEGVIVPIFVLEVRSGVASAGELSIGECCCGVTFGVVHGLFAILVAHLVPKAFASLAVQLVVV